MATLAGGENFTSTPTGVTGARLDNHVNGGSVSNINQADMASSVGAIVRSASAPSDTDAGWWDTANNVFRIHNGTAWLPVATGALLTNKSGGQVVAGDVVVADTTTAESFKTSTTQGDTTVIGVAAETIAADASGVVLYGGIQDVLITGSATLGQFLRQSTTAKKAEATAAKGAGSFGLVLEAGTNTLIKALITGASVTVLDATAAETISGDWDFTAGITGDFSPRASFSNLKITRGSATAVTVTADDLVLYDTNNKAKVIHSVSETITITTSGASGLVSALSEAANTIYYIWIARKSADGTVNGFLSTSSAYATVLGQLDSGYDQLALVGCVGNDNSSNFIDFIQHGTEYTFVSWPTIVSGNTSDVITAIDLTPATLSFFVPGALSTIITIAAYCDSTTLVVGNNASIAASSSDSANKMTMANDNGAINVATFNIITADSLWWGSGAANNVVRLCGFKLNLL